MEYSKLYLLQVYQVCMSCCSKGDGAIVRSLDDKAAVCFFPQSQFLSPRVLKYLRS